MRRADLIGREFGLLRVVDGAGSQVVGGGRQSAWVCECACGARVTVPRSYLVDGRKRYCSRERHMDDFREAVRRGRSG